MFLLYFKFNKNAILYYWAPILGAYIPDLDALPLLSKWHRVLCHNIIFLGLIVAGFVIIKLPLLAIQLFFLGFLSHLILDSATKMGINWAIPFGEFRIRGPVETGSIIDYLIGFTFLLIGLLMVVV